MLCTSNLCNVVYELCVTVTLEKKTDYMESNLAEKRQKYMESIIDLIK